MTKKEAPDVKAFLASADQFIRENPAAAAVAMCLLGYVALCGGSTMPKWAEGLAPVSPKVSGPWRGKGSFGKGFGPQVSR